MNDNGKEEGLDFNDRFCSGGHLLDNQIINVVGQPDLIRLIVLIWQSHNFMFGAVKRALEGQRSSKDDKGKQATHIPEASSRQVYIPSFKGGIPLLRRKARRRLY